LVTGDSYQRAFLWQNGSLRDLGGSLGGNNTGAIAINDDGAAVGFAYLAGETTYHATRWRRAGRMTDLGTVGRDPCAFAQGVTGPIFCTKWNVSVTPLLIFVRRSR